MSSICKKVPQLPHFDRAEPTDRETSLSTYKMKSPSQVSNSLPEENVPSISEILFGDSDHENNSANNPNRTRPENSHGCFVRIVKKSAVKGVKPASFQGVALKDKNLDIDPNDLFDNFGSLFSVRFMSDEEYTQTVQGKELRHLRRELLHEFANEEVKPKPVKTVIRLKRRPSDHPNNGEQKTVQTKPISTKLPALVTEESEQSFSREITNKPRDYRIRKTSREKLLTPLMNGKLRLGVEVKSRDRSQDMSLQNASQNKIVAPFDYGENDLYSLNDIKQRSRYNSRVLRDLSCSKINETEEINQKNTESPKLEDIPKITNQILKDITNYNHKAFKPYFPFENGKENKENEPRKTDFSHIIRTHVPQEEYFSRESIPTRNLSLPRDFESHTDRSCQEPGKKGKKFFMKNPKATLEIPRHPGNVSQRPSFKEETSITSRTDSHQVRNIKARERKALTKVVHPPLKLKVKNPNQIKKDFPAPKVSKLEVQKNPVMNYMKILNEIWGKDGKRATSVPRR